MQPPGPTVCIFERSVLALVHFKLQALVYDILPLESDARSVDPFEP